MTPEATARETIDRKLASAGWLVQDVKEIKTYAADVAIFVAEARKAREAA